VGSEKASHLGNGRDHIANKFGARHSPGGSPDHLRRTRQHGQEVVPQHAHLITDRQVGKNRRRAPVRHRRLIGVLDALRCGGQRHGERPPGVRPSSEGPGDAGAQPARGGRSQGCHDAIQIGCQRRRDGDHGPHRIAPCVSGLVEAPLRYTKNDEGLAPAAALGHPELMDR
jgi:hypothetical protein